jgi:hypothetical protein
MALVWQIARPVQFFTKEGMKDLAAFIDALSHYVRKLGDEAIALPFSRLPWTPRGITLNFHSVGFEPNTYHYKAGFLKNWIQIDSLGHTGWHSNNGYSRSIPQTSLAKKRARTLARRLDAYVQSRSSKYVQKLYPISIQGDYIFFPLQKLQDDTSVFARVNLEEAIRAIEAWCRSQKLKLVLKRHPFCQSKFINALLQGFQSPYIVVTDGHVADLIDGSKFVVTVNSSVGFEALARGRVVVTLGQSEYGDYALQVRKIADLKPALARALREAPDKAATQKFVMGSMFEKDNELDLAHFCEQAKLQYGLISDPIPPLKSEIAFNELGNGRPYLLHGFSFPEEWGVWSNDELSTMVFRAEAGIASCQLMVRGYVKPGWPEIFFDVFANGELVCERSVFKAGMGDSAFEFRMPLQQGINTLTIRVRNPIRPVDLGADFDVRRIGLGIVSMRAQ